MLANSYQVLRVGNLPSKKKRIRTALVIRGILRGPILAVVVTVAALDA